jgi:pectate lyase
MTTTARLRRRVLGAGVLGAAIVAVTLSMTVPQALAATLFSSDFESGTSGWSKSGGDWSVVSDGSQVIQQASSTVERAREFAGSTGWTNYSVQARVKAVSFGSGGVVALASRVSSATKMYRLALTSANRAELQVMDGSSVTVLGSASVSTSTGTWYTLRIDTSGSTISGYLNGTSVGSATDTAYSAGQVGLLTAYASARFDDVTVSDSSTAPPTTPPPTSSTTGPTTSPTTPPPTTPPPTDNTALVGWATQGGGTTGGAGGSTVTVTSLSALTSAVTGNSASTVRVSGLFSCSDDVRVGSNKTVLGVGPGSGLTGCGLNLKGVSNVIVRNMNISKVLAGNGNGDAIHVEGSTRLWFDHNDLSSDTSHGTDYYDGLLDLTHAADYITVSWNRLHDHVKCSLVGHSDNNASEDTGHLRVTYHHNAFINCAQRNPRVRFGNPVHVYNNYYYTGNSPDYSYGVATTCGAGVLVESNYFENVTDPTHLSEGSSPGGSLVARNNYLVNSGPVLTSGSVASIPYSYSVDTASSVKSIVTSGAGTGRITT